MYVKTSKLRITFKSTSLADCDIMRSRTSWEVAEEAKENWFLEEMVVEKSSEKELLLLWLGAETEVSSGMEEVLLLELEWWGARALETSRAEALHERDRNSMGTRGLSGRGVGTNSGRRQFMVHFGSMCLSGELTITIIIIVFLGLAASIYSNTLENV